jgi:hypothetical protein
MVLRSFTTAMLTAIFGPRFCSHSTARKCLGTLKVMHVMFFCHGLVMDHAVPPSTSVSGVYYAKLLSYNAFWCQ